MAKGAASKAATILLRTLVAALAQVKQPRGASLTEGGNGVRPKTAPVDAQPWGRVVCVSRTEGAATVKSQAVESMRKHPPNDAKLTVCDMSPFLLSVRHFDAF